MSFTYKQIADIHNMNEMRNGRKEISNFGSNHDGYGGVSFYIKLGEEEDNHIIFKANKVLIDGMKEFLNCIEDEK